MKNFKKMMAATMMTAILMVGTSFGGVIVNGVKGDEKQPCTQKAAKSFKGVILQDLTGVIVNGFTGVIVNGFTGVIVNGFDGVIVNGAAGSKTECGVIVNG